MKRKKIVTIVGTRPEAIKMAPVMRELARRADVFEQIIVTTGQHRQMLDQVFAAFKITPDIDLNLMRADQSLTELAGRSLIALADVFVKTAPDVVLVQGDTTTVLAASLAAAYAKIQIGHVEAGLRSFDRLNPFPEELNRRVASCVVDLNFAPTERARANLLREGIEPGRIFVTGNTIVDALRSFRPDGAFEDPALSTIDLAGKRMLLVTAHRRENHGHNLRCISAAILRLVQAYDDIEVIFPVHLNPNVLSVVREVLSDSPRVHLVAPVSYGDLLRLLHRCHIVLTDSGGIQEEAPSFQKPVLILREVTERPEILEANAGKIVGTDTDKIFAEASTLFDSADAYRAMTSGVNPFGDGHAAERIVAVLSEAAHAERVR